MLYGAGLFSFHEDTMTGPRLTTSNGGDSVQAMPYVENYIDLTSGVVEGKSIIYCKVGGDIALTFKSEETKPTSMTEGESRTLPYGCSVEITAASGTFDFA